MSEEWRPIPGWEGFYEVSSEGRVRSVERTVPNRPGVFMTLSARVLRLGENRGYPVAWLTRGNQRREFRVSTLVCEAWHGPRPEGMVCRHLDDVKTNNTPQNLRWGTASENTYDKVRNGLHPMASKTHCKRGHPFNDINTYIYNGTRHCRTCRAEAKRARRARIRKAAA